MSALQQILDRRRGESDETAPLCHTLEANASALIVVISSKQSWILPWHHLASARLAKGDERDELRLTFTDHEVTLVGRRLGVLAELIATSRLGAVRAAPAKYAKIVDTEPFIEVIHLKHHDAEAEPPRS